MSYSRMLETLFTPLDNTTYLVCPCQLRRSRVQGFLLVSVGGALLVGEGTEAFDLGGFLVCEGQLRLKGEGRE